MRLERLRTVAATVLLSGTAAAPVLAQAGRRGDVLDANTASEKQLAAVSGMTPARYVTLE